nr:vegetative cell wall protein gp1-like [Procambarus clarkii]
MRLRGSVPSSIMLLGFPIRVFHAGQPRTCFRCGLPGHLAAGCEERRVTPVNLFQEEDFPPLSAPDLSPRDGPGVDSLLVSAPVLDGGVDVDVGVAVAPPPPPGSPPPASLPLSPQPDLSQLPVPPSLHVASPVPLDVSSVESPAVEEYVDPASPAEVGGAVGGSVLPPESPPVPTAGDSPRWEVAPAERDLVVVLRKDVRHGASAPMLGGGGPDSSVSSAGSLSVQTHVGPREEPRVPVDTQPCAAPREPPSADTSAKPPSVGSSPVLAADGSVVREPRVLDIVWDDRVREGPWCSSTIWVPKLKGFIYGVPDWMPRPCASPGKPVPEFVQLVWEAYCLRFPAKEFPDKYR